MIDTEVRQHIDTFVANWTAELEADADSERQEPLQVLAYRLPESIGWLPDYDAWEADVLEELRAFTTRWLSDRRAAEATWREPTANDRIDMAFDALEAEGLVALSHAGTTIEDGWARVGLALREGASRGAVFFHQQDVIDALEGRSMALAFGAFDEAPEHDRAASEIGGRVLDALERHGVSAEWSGSPRDRIVLAPFVWQARRFGSAPEGGSPPRPMQRPLALSASAHAQWRADAPYSREQCVQAVYAKYDTLAIDLDLSARLRGAWTVYAGGRGHAHHHGLPHTFVRAGEQTTLWPGPALENLACDEARVWWEGARDATKQGR